MWETYVVGVYFSFFFFFFPNLLHIYWTLFPILSLPCQESFSHQLIIRQGHFVYSHLHLPEIRAVLVLQHNLWVGVLTLLGKYIPRCKAMYSKRNLTWEQYTPGNSSQDSILCLFLQTCKALDGSLPLLLAFCCHLNLLTVYKSTLKVGRVTIREEMVPF